MSKTMVSIIVPNYNHMKYLPQRMESIFSQTVRDYEIILLDDCSTDGSREWLESMKSHPKVKHVAVNRTNSGSPFKQWRKGMELAEGELVWIAESDDFCDPELLETLLAPFDSNPDLVLSFCRSMLTDSTGAELKFHSSQAAMNEPRTFCGETFVRKYLSTDNVVVNASSALFRKSAALKMPQDYMEFNMVGDWLFWACLCMQGFVAYSPLPLNKFRQHENGTTISASGSVRNYLERIRLFSRFRSLNMIGKAAAYKQHFLCYYHVVYRLHARLSPEQKAMMNENIPLPVKVLARIKHVKRKIFKGEVKIWKVLRVISDPDLRSQFLLRFKYFRYPVNTGPRLLLCCIGKEENRYAREFVEWYRGIGFDKVVIYDNNSADGERFETVLADYIAAGFVQIIDFRGRKLVQLAAYEDCYRRFGAQYDWLAFFDMDEFLETDGFPSAKDYFSSDMFRRYDMIHINWQCYGDNDQVHYVDRPLRERFPVPIVPVDDVNNHIKSVVRGGISDLNWTSTPHTPFPNMLRCANSAGRRCEEESPFTKCEISVARLRHHLIKSTQEFRDKVLRGYPDHIVSHEDMAQSVDMYFRYCRRTPEKEKMLTLDGSYDPFEEAAHSRLDNVQDTDGQDGGQC